jgi:beta-glucosidase
LQARWKDGRLIVTFDVNNRGERSGIDVPQIYVTLPGSGQTRRLAGWSRISLKAGETKHVEVTADARILASYDSAQHAWQRAAGSYQVQLGHSSSSFEGSAVVDLPGGSCDVSTCSAPP